MKKPRKKYTLKVVRREESEFDTQSYFLGYYETTAVSIRQAWNNIRYSNGFNDSSNDYASITYHYEVTDIEDIDPDVPTYQLEDDFEPEPGEDISLFEEQPEEEKLPLYATIDGIDYILTDNGEYTEIFD